MAPGTHLVWTIYKNMDGIWEPTRQSQRYTRRDNQFENRAIAEQECEWRNSNGYTKSTPLQLIPDKTNKIEIK